MSATRIITLLSLVFVSFCVTEAKGWRGLVPLHSTRNDVRRLFGRPLPWSGQFDDIYDIEDARVIVKYIRKRCDVGNWNVARYTVAVIYVEIRRDKWFPITDLGIPDLEKLK